MFRAHGALLLALVCTSARALEPGEAAGPLRFETLSGDAITVNNYAERPATALLWLSGRCEATDKAIDHVNSIYEKHRLRNGLFLGICSNAEESGDELRTFAQGRGIIFPVYRDPQGEVAGKLAAQATPEVFLLDSQGKLVFHGGLHDEVGRNAFEAALESVLKKQPVAAASYAVGGTPLAKPGSKRAIEDRYGVMSFSSEMVFERIPQAPAHHCSSICQSANGDLVCVWYGGSYESADDQALFLARRKPHERTWSKPTVLAQNASQPPGNAVIFRDPTDRLWIIWARMEGTRPMRRGSGWGQCRLIERTSSDDGATWSEDKTVLPDTMGGVPRNGPIALEDGSLLLPDGQSHFLSLAKGQDVWQRVGTFSGGSQPAVVQRHDGSLLALLRRSGHIMQIESRDGGRNWSSAVPTALKNPGSGITMTRLANGHLVLVFNDSQTDRTPLSIARSLDEGKTWEPPWVLETNRGEYSYPYVIQTSDGQLHVTYTFRRYAIKHVELNENWLVHDERPN